MADKLSATKINDFPLRYSYTLIEEIFVGRNFREFREFIQNGLGRAAFDLPVLALSSSRIKNFRMSICISPLFGTTPQAPATLALDIGPRT